VACFYYFHSFLNVLRVFVFLFLFFTVQIWQECIMTGPHFHPNFLYVPFFRFHYLQNGVQLPSICSLWELEFAQWCRFYLLLIDQKLLRGGGRPVTVVHKQHSTCLFFLFFFFHFPICCVFARFVMVTRRGVGLAGRNSNLRSQSVQYDAV
jgi:hypothetical protein